VATKRLPIIRFLWSVTYFTDRSSMGYEKKLSFLHGSKRLGNVGIYYLCIIMWRRNNFRNIRYQKIKELSTVCVTT